MMTIGNTLLLRLQPIQQAWERLSVRDRLALTVLSVFLVTLLIGWSVWSAHRAAKTATEAATEAHELLSWLRAQAPNVRLGGANAALPLSELANQLAAQQGLILTQTGDSARLQVATKHENFAVLGGWLSQLADQGVQVQQLDIQQQANGELQLQATLSMQ